MTNNTVSPTEVETGSYLTAYLYGVPKKNHDVITQNLKKFIPWFEKNGVRLEYYNLAGRETQEVVDSSNAAGMEGYGKYCQNSCGPQSGFFNEFIPSPCLLLRFLTSTDE